MKRLFSFFLKIGVGLSKPVLLLILIYFNKFKITY